MDSIRKHWASFIKVDMNNVDVNIYFIYKICFTLPKFYILSYILLNKIKYQMQRVPSFTHLNGHVIQSKCDNMKLK